ncbi:MAG: tripartite tricarboxylate transporter substrate binding protein [Burkholderiales bacterium]|nr:tripartite tricarboxylate transporter substrate binding protein [Burkholderiales bacterium]
MSLRVMFAATIAAAALPPCVQAADDWPVRSIRMIIPFPPGGSNDIIGRLLGMHLGERVGKQIVVDNRAGAGGNLGTDIAAKSNPDGYTMLIISAAYAFGPSMYQKLPFDPVKAFVPVAKIGNGPNVVSIFPGLPARTAKELIALAKAKPGQLNFASSGVGSSVHLASELFKSMAAIDIVHIPFKGGFPAMVDVMSGNSQIIIGTLVQALPHIKSGKLRALGMASKQRSAAMPELPTIDESGLPGYEAANWWGIMFPAGTPGGIVDRIDRELAQILLLPDIRKRFAADGAEPEHLSQGEFGKFIAAETAKWSRVVKQAGIKPQ